MKLLKILVPFAMLAVLMAACNLDDTVSSDNPDSGSDIKLVINEYLASNDACCFADFDFPDWFEIYNYGTEAVDIGGMYVSDSKSDYKAFQIPTGHSDETTIQPGGFLVIFCDGMPERGTLHTSFKLGSGGEDITLTESNGLAVIDELTFGPQDTDVSEGRNPDGSDNWQKYTTPTPGASNTGEAPTFPPSITNIAVTPETINPGDPVTVTATVTDDDGDLQNVKITYGTDLSAGTEKDMTASGDDYSADLGSFDDGNVVYFFITANDAEGQTTVSDTLSFQVGFVPPVLFINEFMASNDACCFSEFDFPDWIEIYNPSSTPVNIGGYYITDGLDELTAWQIPDTQPDSTTIPANGFLVLFADKNPESGVLHVNLKLSGGGEQIGLTAPNGTTIIDSLTYGEQTTDVSEGRLPDGSDNWTNFENPTPGASNN